MRIALPVLLMASFSIIHSLPALAGPQIGTLTQVSGSVQIFSYPSKDGTQGPAPHAKFEGTIYSVRNAAAGDPVDKGNILRTSPGARAVVIFDNGDQYYVAPATSFRIDWDKDDAKTKSQLELRYGKSRFVIGKGGPRSRLQIRTRTATLGVRGTDFFVAVSDATGATEAATLRGSVLVASHPNPAAPASNPTIVSAGETASVPLATAEGKATEIELHKTTQGELQAIQRTSAVAASEKAPTPEVAQKIEALRVAAAQTTLQDIRAEDPTLAAKLENQGSTGPENLNQAVVANLERDAPNASGVAGPIADESLEKGSSNAAPSEQTPPAGKQEEPPPPLRKVWIGLKLGTMTASIDRGADATEPDEMRDPLKKSLLGLTAEYPLNRNIAFVAELFPYATHGYQLPTLAAASLITSVKAIGTDLFVGIKPGITVTERQTLCLYLLAGLRGTKIWSATGNPDSSQELDIASQTSSFNTAIELGLGISIKGTERLKFSGELRGFHGMGNLISGGSGSNLPSGASQDSAGLLGVSYGI